MKILMKILIVLVLIIVVALIAKNQIVRLGVQQAVKMTTGLDAHISHASLGVLKTSIGFYDFVLNNSSKYKDRTFITLPEIFVDYDLSAIIKGDVHLQDVRINISELVIIKNADGSMNFNDMKAPPPASGPQPKVRIDHFSLKLGKVIFKDYSRGGEPKVKEYDLNVNEEFTNLTGTQDLVPLLTGKVMLTVQRILINSSISDFSNIGGDLVGGAGHLIGGAADLSKEGVSAAADKIKGLFQ